MSKKEIKVKIVEEFKNGDIEKRREALDEMLYKIIKAKEIIVTEIEHDSYGVVGRKRCIKSD